MNKQSLVNTLSRKLKTDRVTTGIFVDALLEEIIQTCSEGNDVKLTNFGQFETRDCPPTQRKNPRTGESIVVPPTTKMRFRPAQQFKDRVANKGRRVESANATITY